MLTSCMDKREIPFSWEEICNLVAAKHHISPIAVIEDGDNLTAEDIVKVLLDSITQNVIGDSIVFGFQDCTIISAVKSNGSQWQNLF